MQLLVLLATWYVIITTLAFIGLVIVAYAYRGARPDSLLGFMAAMARGSKFSHVCDSAFRVAWRWPVPVLAIITGAFRAISGEKEQQDDSKDESDKK